MPTIEGLTPATFWTTMAGMFSLCAAFLIVYKVYDAVVSIIDRRKKKREAEKPDFAEEVSRKVIEKLEPRFEAIEHNLDKDKNRLETHDNLIASMSVGQREIHDGLSAIAKFMLVISTYGNIGNNDKVKEASAELQKYLAEKL